MSSQDQSHVDNPKPVNLHERILEAITTRIESLSSGAPAGAGGASWSSDEVEQRTHEAQADEKQLREHWTTNTSQTYPGSHPPPLSQACGKPQPCPHTLELAVKYGITPF